MTRLVIFGATGPSGRAATRAALEAGHDVIAAVRRPEALAIAPGLEVRRADVLDPAQVGAGITGASAVILCLGTKPGETRAVLTEGTGHVIDAMHQLGIRRLVVQGSLPLDGDWTGAALGARLIYRLLSAMAGPIVADKQGQRRLVEASGLDWLLVRPTLLADGPARGAWTVTQAPKVRTFDMVRRADIGAFLVQEATAPTLSGSSIAFLPPGRSRPVSAVLGDAHQQQVRQ